MPQLTVGAQIFALFYAVLYGALFTISDRWRPFFVRHGSKQGKKRLLLALVFFGAFPAGYFVIALPVFLRVREVYAWVLPIAMYSVLPLYAFHCGWSWIVQASRTTFYSPEELAVDPIKSSFCFVGDGPLDVLAAVLILAFAFVGPLVSLLLVCMWATA